MKFKLLLLFSILIFAVSCNVFKAAQSPKKSYYADTLSTGIYNRIHQGYSNMLISSNKTFPLWQPFYESNIHDIGVLLKFDSLRGNNAGILKLTNDWRNRLSKYMDEHSNLSTLNNGQITIYRDAIDIAGNKVVLYETNLKQ